MVLTPTFGLGTRKISILKCSSICTLSNVVPRSSCCAISLNMIYVMHIRRGPPKYIYLHIIYNIVQCRRHLYLGVLSVVVCTVSMQCLHLTACRQKLYSCVHTYYICWFGSFKDQFFVARILKLTFFTSFKNILVC